MSKYNENKYLLSFLKEVTISKKKTGIESLLWLYMTVWDLFVCWGLTSILNIWGQIVAVVLWPMSSHIEMPCRRHRTWHPSVTVYRHKTGLSLCYPLIWNVKLEYTASHFNVLGETRSGNSSLTFHIHQQTLNFMMLLWWLSVRSSVESIPYAPSLEPVVCASINYLLTYYPLKAHHKISIRFYIPQTHYVIAP